MSRRWQPSPDLLADLRRVTADGDCESCGRTLDDGGCRHDGRAWCRYCLHKCSTCLEAIKDSDARAAVRLQPIRRPGMNLRPKKAS